MANNYLNGGKRKRGVPSVLRYRDTPIEKPGLSVVHVYKFVDGRERLARVEYYETDIDSTDTSSPYSSTLAMPQSRLVRVEYVEEPGREESLNRNEAQLSLG